MKIIKTTARNNYEHKSTVRCINNKDNIAKISNYLKLNHINSNFYSYINCDVKYYVGY
jgi:hypothetical protein